MLGRSRPPGLQGHSGGGGAASTPHADAASVDTLGSAQVENVKGAGAVLCLQRK